MKQVFEIPGSLPGINAWTQACKSHYGKAGKMKRDAQDLIGYCIKAAKIKPCKSRIFVRFTWIESNMKRDLDNIAFAKKFVFDALQEMGVIENDGWNNVEGFSDKFMVNKSNPRIIVEIEEVEDDYKTKARSRNRGTRKNPR